MNLPGVKIVPVYEIKNPRKKVLVTFCVQELHKLVELGVMLITHSRVFHDQLPAVQVVPKTKTGRGLVQRGQVQSAIKTAPIGNLPLRKHFGTPILNHEIQSVVTAIDPQISKPAWRMQYPKFLGAPVVELFQSEFPVL